MTNLSTAISIATDRRQMPAYQQGDIGSLARGLNLTAPVSVVNDLLPALNSLPFQAVTISSGAKEADFVHGSAQVGLQSNGQVSFRGHVEEHGLVGENFLFAAALLDLVDSSGENPVFVKIGNVEGTANIGGNHTADFQIDSSVQVIADQWDSAKNTRVQFSLQTQLNEWQLTEGLVSGLFGIKLVLMILEGGQPGSSNPCTWGGDTETGALQQCQPTN